MYGTCISCMPKVSIVNNNIVLTKCKPCMKRHQSWSECTQQNHVWQVVFCQRIFGTP